MILNKKSLLGLILKKPELLDILGRDVELVEKIEKSTNDNYKVSVNDLLYVLRIPSCPHPYTDRLKEKQNAKLMSDSKINVPLIYFDEEGVQLTIYWNGSRPLKKRDFLHDAILESVITELKTVHQSPVIFSNETDIFKTLDDLLKKNSDSKNTEDEINTIKTELKRFPKIAAPCHNDPMPHNILIKDHEIKIIDWEFSGMHDPYWDLAYLCDEIQSDETLDKKVLHLYESSEKNISRFLLYKKTACLLKQLWGCSR